jgi:hypothetical protein
MVSQRIQLEKEPVHLERNGQERSEKQLIEKKIGPPVKEELYGIKTRTKDAGGVIDNKPGPQNTVIDDEQQKEYGA